MIINDLMYGICLVLIATLIGALSAVMFKFASKELEKGLSNFFKNIKLYIGIILYGISALIFVFALKFGDLSALYPVVALSYIWVSLLSIKFLNEKMTTYKWLGIILIIIGVVFIGIGA